MAEQYPTDVTLNALSGSTDGEQEVAYPTIAESPYYTSFYKMLYRLLNVARRAGDLRVFKDGTNTFGVRGGEVMVGDTAVAFAEATGQSLTNDATNYIYLTAAGTLTVNTTGFPSPSAGPHVPLATIAVGSESEAQVDDEYDFVDITDYRGRSMFRVLGEVAGVGGKVRNATGADLGAGDLAYVSGYNATDDCPEIALADADDPAKRATHVLLEDIDDGETGAASGYAVLTADTTGRTVGDLLYLSATAGEWTATAPAGAGQLVQVAGVVKAVGASGEVEFVPGLGIVQAAGASFLQDQAVTQDKLNDAQAERIAIVHVEDLAAGADIATPRPIFVHPRAVTLVSVGILTEGASAGVDDTNMATLTIRAGMIDTIVAKTYNTANQPPSGDYEDLGALDAAHKILTAGEYVTLQVIQGPTADLPAFSIVLRYTVEDA